MNWHRVALRRGFDVSSPVVTASRCAWVTLRVSWTCFAIAK